MKRLEKSQEEEALDLSKLKDVLALCKQVLPSFFVSNISQCHLKKVKCHFMVTDNSHITVTRQDF